MKTKAEQVFDKMMTTDYCSQWMNIQPVLIEEGHCIIEMQVRREMLNGYGILHGGIAFAFADSAFAFASNSYDRLALSILGSMNYVQSAKEGQWLIAEAKALNVGYRTADFDVIVCDKSTRDAYYHFRGTVYRSSKSVLSSNEN